MLDRGAVISGKYRVERVIGRGGMGTVVEVTHAQLGTPFALKFLHGSAIADPEIAERFFREARAAAALRSEHVCRVFDVEAHDGVPYLVMERLEGMDLGQLLEGRGRLPAVEAVDLVLQACVGIAEAHAARIVHRDLKPGNLFLTARPDGAPLVKVLDFGVAKLPLDVGSALTGTGALLGSPSYMSPEQLRSSRLVDARGDLWSLGVILFELVAGSRPFVGHGLPDIALKIIEAPVPRLPEGPAELDLVIARCLERDLERRYQTVAELVRALVPFAGPVGRHAAARLLGGPGGPGVSEPGVRERERWSEGASAAAPPRAGGGCFRGGPIWILAGAMAFGIIAAVMVSGGGGGDGGERPADAAPVDAAPADAEAGVMPPPADAEVAAAPVDAAPADAAPADATPADATPADAMPIDAAPVDAAPTPRPRTRRPAVPARKPSTRELGKSRI